jgi:DNA-binding transcriptional ArsR family regulator
MSASALSAVEPDLWRALASPHRRALLDILRAGPATTRAMAAGLPELSRFAVMQHLGVLVDAGVVLVERRGRDRINHLNPVPLREWYERWVVPMADADAAALLALKRYVETEALDEGAVMSATEPLRSVRLTSQLHIAASAERTFEVMTQRIREWYPHSYGDARTQRVVLEPRLGGAHYEDWGDGAGHLYGQVTAWDPPRTWSTRGRISPGSVLDTRYEISPDGEGVVVRVSKVAVGPFTDDEVASIAEYGDISPYAGAIEKLARA